MLATDTVGRTPSERAKQVIRTPRGQDAQQTKKASGDREGAKTAMMSLAVAKRALSGYENGERSAGWLVRVCPEG